MKHCQGILKYLETTTMIGGNDTGSTKKKSESFTVYLHSLGKRKNATIRILKEAGFSDSDVLELLQQKSRSKLLWSYGDLPRITADSWVAKLRACGAFVTVQGFGKGKYPEGWKTAFPIYKKERHRLYQLRKTSLLEAELPHPNLESILDRYCEQYAEKFPFMALYVSTQFITQYRTLAIRLKARNGEYLKTGQLFSTGQIRVGNRKLSACQYVTSSNVTECYHAERPCDLALKLQEDPEFLTEVINNYPRTVGKAIQSMKNRKIWPQIIANVTGQYHEKDPSFQPELKSMFEVYTFHGLNYIGAPIKRKKDSISLGVVCLLHANEIPEAGQQSWTRRSNIEELAKEIASTPLFKQTRK